MASLLGTHEVSLLLCRSSHPAGPGLPAGLFSCTVPSRDRGGAEVGSDLGQRVDKTGNN